MKIKFHVLPVFLCMITNCLLPPSAFAQTIAAGGSHSIAICSDKTIMAWGGNNIGQLGDGTNIDSSLVPVHISSLTSIISVASGSLHSLALNTVGSVWAWGINDVGQLGTGSSSFSSNVPLQIISLTGIAAIAGGTFHSLALKNNGIVWTWGGNNNGELGNGTNTSSNVPVQVNSLTGIIAIAAGGDHSIALKNDGTLWAWGRNTNGQLGNGTNSFFENVPVQVNSLTGITAITAGANYSLALKNDGTVWAWGSNSNGELGNGNNFDSNIPVQVSSLASMIAIAGGGWHCVGLKNDGTVWTWGSNSSGELGNGSNTGSNIPVPVSYLTGITAIASYDYHSLCLKNNGTIWAWGSNSSGELGNGSNISSNIPVQVTGLCVPLTNVLNEIDEPLNISIFPNPSIGIFNMQKNKFENIQIKIYNLYGECIHQQIIQSENQQIDVSLQPNGIYFLNIKTKKETILKKIIINKI